MTSSIAAMLNTRQHYYPYELSIISWRNIIISLKTQQYLSIPKCSSSHLLTHPHRIKNLLVIHHISPPASLSIAHLDPKSCEKVVKVFPEPYLAGISDVIMVKNVQYQPNHFIARKE